MPDADHAIDSLQRGAVDVWYVDTAECTDALLSLELETPRLAAQDHARAAVTGGGDPGHPRARERRAIYVALRLVLERAFGLELVRGREMLRSELGRPSLPGCPGDFSLAHVPGHALLGVARRGSIGVDIERRRLVRMTDTRQAAIVRAAMALNPDFPLPQTPPDRFLAAWVRLEAFAKAKRVGMARVLTASGALGRAGALADQDLRQRLSALGVTGAGSGAAGPAFAVRDVSVDVGLFAALARVADEGLAGDAASPEVRHLPAALDPLRTLSG